MLNFFKFFFVLFFLSYWAAIGQTQSSFLPQNLGPNVNTEEQEIAPVISPDGKTLYFVRTDSVASKYWRQQSQYIWFSELQPDNTWSKAQKMPETVNLHTQNAVLGVAPDGNTLFINGRFTKKGRWHKRGISMITKTDGNWTHPKRLYVRGLQRMNKGLFSNASFSSDGQWLFISMSKRSGSKNNNLYVAQRHDDIYWRPRKLKKPLKHHRADEAPFLSSDQNFLYFSSNRKTGKGGVKHEIYKSARKDESYRRYEEPIALSDTINSELWDSYFITNPKGSWAYYCTKNKSTGKSDIFRVKIFEENPFVVVSGKVLNQKDDLPLAANIPYKVYSNDKPVDSATFNSATGEYKIKLPLGGKYMIKAVAKNYESVNIEEIDVVTVREYTEATKNLYVKPSNALVKGKLLEQFSQKPIASDLSPVFYINGEELTPELAQNLGIDSFLVDFDNGNYLLKLPLKKSYSVQLKAKGMQSSSSKIDLSTIDEYKEIEKDLFVSNPPKLYLLITGIVYNKKTNKPLLESQAFEIQVNDDPAALAKIDRSTARYEVKLDLGKQYTIHAESQGFYPISEIVDATKETSTVKVVKDIYIAPIEVGASIKLNNIFFDFGKSTLKPASFPELDKLVDFLNDNPTIKVEIAGHTDNKGKPDKNLQLSRWRARAVQLYLLEKGGLTAARVKFNGYGQTKPVAENKTEKGRAQNRRVEFTILGK